ncbi:MAG: LptA/OstA family protein [Hyphomicrobiales bacterium]
MRALHATQLDSAIVAAAILMVAFVLTSPLSAQTLSNSFGGLSESSDEPIDIESDMLTVYDAQKYATFKGNVKAVQGTTTLRAAELDVHYVGGSEKLTGQAGEAKPADNNAAEGKTADDPEAKISKIEARGNVVITSEDDQTTTSDWALYDVPAQIVTVGGNVVLSQGQNVLKGDRLVIDLKTGESKFENTGNAAAGGGRIRALFMPKGGAPGADEEDGGKKRKRPHSAKGEAQTAPGAADETPVNDSSGADNGEPLPIVPEVQ